MKIVSYNIAQCTQAKINAILEMQADIYILPECASYQHITLPDDYNMLWTGDDDYTPKGLGIIWHKNISIQQERVYKKIPHILPLRINNAGNLRFILASWPTTRKTTKTYPQLLLEALKEYECHLQQSGSIVVGDFNCFIGQKNIYKKTGTFEDCIEYMKSLGLRSMYHELSGEAFGKETVATFYWKYNRSNPFFLDYAFSNIKPYRFHIGCWNKKISDHCPLHIELEDETY